MLHLLATAVALQPATPQQAWWVTLSPEELSALALLQLATRARCQQTDEELDNLVLVHARRALRLVIRTVRGLTRRATAVRAEKIDKL